MYEQRLMSQRSGPQYHLAVGRSRTGSADWRAQDKLAVPVGRGHLYDARGRSVQHGWDAARAP